MSLGRALARRAAAVFTLASLASLASFASLEAAAQSNAPAGITLTGALRLATLAERVAKLHAQAGQGILAERSRRELAQTLRDFDSLLRAVAPRASTPESRDNYALLALLLQDYREWALRAPSRDSARRLRPRTEEVVWIASKGAKLLQQEGRVRANAAAMRAQNAATLAQRAAKLELWAHWEIRDDALARELHESRENLRRAMDALAAAPAASPEVASELLAAATQLRFMEDAEHALAARQDPARQAEFIAKTGDHIEESMERIAGLYEAER